MIKCKPERNSKKAVMLLLLFAVLAVLTGLAASIASSYKGIYQIGFILVLCVGINTVVRYTMSEMEYTLTEDSFEVRKKVGDKVTLLCSLAISETVVLTDKKTYVSAPKAYGYISRKFNFNQNVFTDSAVYICKFNGQNYLVEFEPNAAFYDCFRQKIAENKK